MSIVLLPEFTGLPADAVLNDLQREVYEHEKVDDKHFLVISKTASGKTACISILARKYLYPAINEFSSKKKLVYVAPLKALVEEKKRDWSEASHPYSQLKIVIITGDYSGAFNEQEANEADIVVITPESLASRLRNMSSEKSSFLNNVGLLAVDEIHLVGEQGRGVNLEIAICEFAKQFPDTQIAGFSGTVPNPHDLTKWLGSLKDPTNPESGVILVDSKYEAVVQRKHYIPFYGRSASESEKERIQLIIREIKKNPNDQHLICVFKKAFGYAIEKALNDEGLNSAFHNADKDRTTRHKLEQAFISGTLRYMVSTKTLFAGVNLPARRVICTHVQAGGEDVHASELNQIAGRAGRPRYDKEGDCTFFVPSHDLAYHQYRIDNGEEVMSQLNRSNLALHFLGAILRKRVEDFSTFTSWYKRTLAHNQRLESDTEIDGLCEKIIEKMQKFGMIEVTDQMKFRLRRKGLITAQLGFDPEHVFGLALNLNKYFTLPAPDEYDLSIALGSCVEFMMGCTQDEMKDMNPALRSRVHINYLKVCSAFLAMMQGTTIYPSLAPAVYKIKDDMGRMEVLINRLNSEVEMWDQSAFCKGISFRILYGASEEQGRLMEQGYTKSEATKLLSNGINSKKQADAFFGMHPESVSKVFTPMRAKKLGYR